MGELGCLLLTHPKLLSLEYARMDPAFLLNQSFGGLKLREMTEVKCFFLDKKEFVCKSAEDGGKWKILYWITLKRKR